MEGNNVLDQNSKQVMLAKARPLHERSISQQSSLSAVSHAFHGCSVEDHQAFFEKSPLVMANSQCNHNLNKPSQLAYEGMSQ